MGCHKAATHLFESMSPIRSFNQGYSPKRDPQTHKSTMILRGYDYMSVGCANVRSGHTAPQMRKSLKIDLAKPEAISQERDGNGHREANRAVLIEAQTGSSFEMTRSRSGLNRISSGARSKKSPI
jgi:hypothetical protein